VRRIAPLRERTIATTHKQYCRCGCGRTVDIGGARGLYSSCYRQIAKYVSDGLTSWEQLEREGKVGRKRETLKDWILSKAI
jgi:hypothetical protein